MNKIIIKFYSRDQVIWNKGAWDDYSYEGPIFVVKKDGRWIGIYNMDAVMAIEVVE